MREGMACDKYPRAGEDTVLDCLFQSELGTATVADAGEAAPIAIIIWAVYATASLSAWRLSVKRFAAERTSSRLREGMACDKYPRAGEDTVLDCLFQSELGTATVASMCSPRL
jgi:hypothetical protein